MKIMILLILIILMLVVAGGCALRGRVMDGDGMVREPFYAQISQDEDNDDAGEKTASLSFESFDGGGPEFNVVIADESIVSYAGRSKYRSSDHEEMDGAGFDVIITFTGIKPGETTVIIEERSPIADNLDHKYRVAVDDELNVQIEQLSVKDINE